MPPERNSVTDAQSSILGEEWQLSVVQNKTQLMVVENSNNDILDKLI